MISYTCIFEIIPGLDSCIINTCRFQSFCIVESNCGTNVGRESIVFSIFGVQIQSGFYNFIFVWCDSVCQIQQADISNHKCREFANFDIHYVRCAFSGLQSQ